MKKIIPILLFLIVLISFVQAETLIDSEDFESYADGDTGATFFDKTNGKWNCTTAVDYPTCLDNSVGSGQGSSLHRIKDESGNKVLEIGAWGGSSTDCYQNSLSWDLIDGTASSNQNHTIKFSIKVRDYNFAPYPVTQGRSLYFLLNDKSNAPDEMTTFLGNLATANQTLHNNMRLFKSGSDAVGNPCYVSDGLWHNMDLYYITNGANIVNKTLYKDGVVCSNYTGISLSSGYFPITKFSYDASCDYNVSIDNLAYYEGFATPSGSPCSPDWTCVGYGTCLENDTKECDTVFDNNACGENYTGDYSEFSPVACDFCEPFWECDGYTICSLGYKTCNSVNDSNECGENYTGGFPYGSPVACSTSCDTTCTTWDLPYFLREDFDGEMGYCDWATSSSNCLEGRLEWQKQGGYYSMNKELTLTSSDVRFVAVSFDFKPSNYNVFNLTPTTIQDGEWVIVSLYDEENQLFIQLLVGENNTFYNNQDGSAVELYSNLQNGTLTNTILNIDLDNDEYDLFYNGVKVAGDIPFTDSILNIDKVNRVMISTIGAGFVLDDLDIYASDIDGDIFVVTETPTTPVNNITSMCGLFRNEKISCNLDSDCLTASCLPSGYCSQFDMTFCDENGHKRGGYCYIAGIVDCTLKKTESIIFDNFLLFLVFLILLIGLVFLMWAVRGK